MGSIRTLGLAVAALLTVGVTSAPGAWAGELAEPVAVEAGGARISVEVGHAAPFVCDWDGDGKPDLLVGQMGAGHLRIYRNTGSASAPAFEGFQLFQVGTSEGTSEGSVPSG